MGAQSFVQPGGELRLPCSPCFMGKDHALSPKPFRPIQYFIYDYNLTKYAASQESTTLALIVIIVGRFGLTLEPLQLGALPLEFALLLVHLRLLHGLPVLLALELIADEAAPQRPHRPADRCASPRRTDGRANDGARSRAQATTDQDALFALVKRVRTSAQDDDQGQGEYAYAGALGSAHVRPSQDIVVYLLYRLRNEEV